MRMCFNIDTTDTVLPEFNTGRSETELEMCTNDNKHGVGEA